MAQDDDRHEPQVTMLHANMQQAGMQPDLFAAEPIPACRPNPDKVRLRLHKILAEARAAQTLPWKRSTVALYQTIFPHMTHWLPEEEGAQLRFAFDTEMERLAEAA